MNIKYHNYIYEAKIIDNYLRYSGNIVVYGIGVNGKKLVDYIIEIGEKDKIKGIVVTDRTGIQDSYKGIQINEAKDYFLYESNSDTFVIVAVSPKYQKDIKMLLKKYGIKKYGCLTRDAYLDIIRHKDQRPRVSYSAGGGDIDFMIAGFVKCGTTSLHQVLMGIESIYVPLEKETHFFWWFDKVENAKRKLIEKYFSDIREGQKQIGAVDPTFYAYASEICKIFGSKVRIIFMMRNPVDAAFSLFKMLNREGNEIFQDIYQKYGVYHKEMFDRYFEDVIKNENYTFNYYYWLKSFLEYFPKEQIHIVFFEELIEFPEKEVNRILKFIGSDEKYACMKFPKDNEGNFVMKSREGYEIAKRRTDFLKRHTYLGTKDDKKREEIQSELIDICSQYDMADKLYHLKPGKREREKLEQYFGKSVRKLEELLSRNLSDIWF